MLQMTIIDNSYPKLGALNLKGKAVWIPMRLPIVRV